MFLLVPAYPGCPGSKAVKRSLLLLYFHVQYIVSMGFEVGESIYDGFTVKACLSVTCSVPRRVEALSADQLAHDVSLPTLPSRLLLVV